MDYRGCMGTRRRPGNDTDVADRQRRRRPGQRTTAPSGRPCFEHFGIDHIIGAHFFIEQQHLIDDEHAPLVPDIPRLFVDFRPAD